MRSFEVKLLHLLAAMMTTLTVLFGVLQLGAFKYAGTDGSSHAARVYASTSLPEALEVESQRLKGAERSKTFQTSPLQAQSRTGDDRTTSATGSIRSTAAHASDTPSGTSSKSKPKRVAIAFYGLTRSLKYTIQSIRENVFEKLTEGGFDYHVYLHTYSLEKTERTRSGESASLNKTEWKLLDADFHKVTSQEVFLEEYKLPIAACRNFSYENNSSASAKDYYKDNFQSITNLLSQLNSLQTVTSMWKSSGHDYHAVLYMRPDVLYNCPFPTTALDTLEQDSIYIADFHHWNGLNDRFAMGAPHTVGLWGNRLKYALATCMQQQLHAERLVNRLLKDAHIHTRMLPFYFFRVRANGLLEARDYKPKLKQHKVQACDDGQMAQFSARAIQHAAREHSFVPASNAKPNTHTQGS